MYIIEIERAGATGGDTVIRILEGEGANMRALTDRFFHGRPPGLELSRDSIALTFDSGPKGEK